MSQSPALPRPRAIVYVDGFNLYYGAIKNGPNKWLNLEQYFRLLRPHDDVRQIYYFTALVQGSNLPNQQTYLRALDTLPTVTVVLGKYKTKQILCRVPPCSHAGVRLFSSLEEKRTDVNIAIQMLDDAYQGLCDNMILVSGDSDLVPVVSRIKDLFPSINIIVYVPARHAQRGAAVELRTAADKHKTLPLEILPKAQFPTSVPDGAGGHITKPSSW